jgi:hypothetical protein
MFKEDQSKPSARPRLSAILPSYNEAEGMAEVLAVLRQVPELDEILVVDDGSTDDTAALTLQSAIKDTRIRLIQLPANQGKGQAIFCGAAATQAEALLLLDADLKDLKPGHIQDLVEPVLAGRADMSLGLFRSGHLNTDLSHRATPWLSGQRCLKADLLNSMDLQAAAGYGFETALTISARQQHARTQVVFLTGVWHPPSELHRGFLKGVGQRARMYSHIFRAWRTARRSPRRLKKFEFPG